MDDQKKLKVMLLYGGRSGEHEVSLKSAASVLQRLDSKRFEVLPVGIDRNGRWYLNDLSSMEKAATSLTVNQAAPAVVLVNQANGNPTQLISMHGQAPIDVDVVFPVLHGTLCEDGTLQGLLEMADLPYVGCGVLASSVGMDKDIAKKLMRDAGLPVVPYLCVKHWEWKKNPDELIKNIGSQFGYPVFIKPANSGSSVGVHKVKKAADLNAAFEDAFSYDTKVLVEKAVSAREIEFAVLENSDPLGAPLVSVPGEIIPTHEFYSYESKYLDEHGANLVIPAKVDRVQLLRGEDLARKTFQTLECEGMSRVDLFLDKVSGEFYINEINTIPGFTSVSMYPKLWEYSGVAYSELLSRLIDLAMARHQRKKKLRRDFL